MASARRSNTRNGDHRIVTRYGYDRTGREIGLARVVYTRRR
jgi:hypothetical protein